MCLKNNLKGLNNVEWNNSDSIESGSNHNELLEEDLNGQDRLLMEICKDTQASKCLNCKVCLR